MNSQMDKNTKLEWNGRVSNPDTTKWKRLGNTIPSKLNRTIKKRKVKRTSMNKSKLQRSAEFRNDTLKQELEEIDEDIRYLKTRRAKFLKEKADVEAILLKEEEGGRHINSSKNEAIRDELIQEYDKAIEPDEDVRELTEMMESEGLE